LLFKLITNHLSLPTIGNAVIALQAQLNLQNNAGLVLDGKFGSLTQAAVREYQASNGLTVDGRVGPQTSGSLGFGYAVPAAKPTSQIISASQPAVKIPAVATATTPVQTVVLPPQPLSGLGYAGAEQRVNAIGGYNPAFGVQSNPVSYGESVAILGSVALTQKEGHLILLGGAVLVLTMQVDSAAQQITNAVTDCRCQLKNVLEQRQAAYCNNLDRFGLLQRYSK
jgi:peptidoglycan hydrolase-like protein with peptidoglycan-binding domain